MARIILLGITATILSISSTASAQELTRWQVDRSQTAREYQDRELDVLSRVNHGLASVVEMGVGVVFTVGGSVKVGLGVISFFVPGVSQGAILVGSVEAGTGIGLLRAGTVRFMRATTGRYVRPEYGDNVELGVLTDVYNGAVAKADSVASFFKWVLDDDEPDC